MRPNLRPISDLMQPIEQTVSHKQRLSEASNEVRRDDDESSGMGHLPALSVRKLEVWRENDRVVRGISFDVPQHSVTALTGLNGVGKSSVLRSIVGLETKR